MRGVVVYRAYDHAASPRSHPSQGFAFEFSCLVAGFHVLHFAVPAIRDPIREDAQLTEVSYRRYTAEIESGVDGALLDTSCKVGGHRQLFEVV